MHDLIAISPLGYTEPFSETIGAVTVAEVMNTAYASVAARMGGEKKTQTAIKKIIGTAAPMAGHFAGKDGVIAIWTGPDQWMIEAPHDTHELLASITAAQTKDSASVSEQNDAWARFDVTGAGLNDVFERLCNANIRAMQAGAAQRSSIHHMGCFILRRAEDHISVISPRSSAKSLHHALVTAVRAVA